MCLYKLGVLFRVEGDWENGKDVLEPRRPQTENGAFTTFGAGKGEMGRGAGSFPCSSFATGPIDVVFSCFRLPSGQFGSAGKAASMNPFWELSVDKILLEVW